MKPDVKKVLEEAFAAPEPKRKKEFLEKIEVPQISSFSFILLQIAYIRKRVLLVSVLLLFLAVRSVDFAEQDCIWVISALMPFLALCVVTESARSETYGMTELEMASRFSLKSIVLARLGAIGLLHFMILCLLVPFAVKAFPVSHAQISIYLRTSVYLTVPYLLTSIWGLWVVRKLSGKEAIYSCMGIAVMVSCLNFVIRGNFPMVYEEKQFIWWILIVCYLFIKAGKEYKKMIYQTEELSWN